MKGFSGPISTWPTNFPVPGALERTAYPFSLLQRLDQILWNFYLIVWQHSNTKITRAAPRPHTGTSTWPSCTHTGPQAQPLPLLLWLSTGKVWHPGISWSSCVERGLGPSHPQYLWLPSPVRLQKQVHGQLATQTAVDLTFLVH